MKIQTAPLGDMGANFYLVKDDSESELFVVDPGGDYEIASELIKSANAKLKYIILTHAHADHIGALDKLKKEFNASVVVGKDDSVALNDSMLSLCALFRMHAPTTKADIEVSDGDELPFGNSKIKIIHTPGHTKGSICIQFDDSLISGDTIFYSSIGRTDFPGGDFMQISESIKNKIYSLDDSVTIYPGHGNPTTVGFEAKNNPFVQR